MGAIISIIFSFMKSLGLKFWLYVLLALAIAGEQLWMYEKGNTHGQDLIKAQDKEAYEKQAALDKKVEAARKSAADKAELEAQKKLADLQKQSEDDANTIKKLSAQASKARKAAQSPTQPVVDLDGVCSLSDDELRNYQKLIDKANNP